MGERTLVLQFLVKAHDLEGGSHDLLVHHKHEGSS